MLDDFKDSNFYDYAINLKKYYHAYLFEVNNIEESFPEILAFSKMIICQNHFTNNKKCGDCNICHLISQNAYSDLKIIDVDGSMIKKEQVLELQKSLSLKSFNNTNQVYIIKNADKMNPSASNSLLKFIEEPLPGIYGILITTNRKQILPTILSRCILICLKGNNQGSYNEDDIRNITNFLSLIDKKKEEAIPYLKQNFFKYYETRDNIILAFNLMEVILDSLIHLKYQNKVILNSNFCDIIESSLGDISVDKIVFYLEKIVKYKNKLINVMNLNLNLFMDRFLIETGEVIE